MQISEEFLITTLDTSDQNLSRGGLVNELGGVGVNGSKLGAFDGTTLINWVTSNIHNTTKGSGTDGNHDGAASIDNILTAGKTLST